MNFIGKMIEYNRSDTGRFFPPGLSALTKHWSQYYSNKYDSSLRAEERNHRKNKSAAGIA